MKEKIYPWKELSFGSKNAANIGSAVQSIYKDSNGGNLYFRGQMGLKYLPLPKAMRLYSKEKKDKKPSPDYEYNVTNSLVTDFPEMFYGVSSITRLSKIQHLDLPTRLMDISASPFTALFFTCDSLTLTNHKTVEPKLSNSIPDNSWLFCYEINHTAVNESSMIASGIDPLHEEFLNYGRDRADTIKRFDSYTGLILSSLSLLTTEQQSRLRYEALMDYMAQIYSFHISEELCEGAAIWKYDFERHTILFSVLRLIFCSIQNAIWKYHRRYTHDSNKSIDDWNNEIQLEIKRKLEYMVLKHKIFKYIEQKVINSIKLDFPSSFSICGYTFTISSCKDCYGDEFCIYYPKRITRNLTKWMLDYWKSEDADNYPCPMFINPETKEYDSGMMCFLFGKIKAEHPGFEMKTDSLTILDGCFVQPAMSSARMIAQQGAFMLYGLSSFWNIRRTIQYLVSRNYDWKSILKILVTEDTSFLCKSPKEHKSPWVGEIDDPEKLVQFIGFVHRASVWTIKSKDIENLKESLDSMGINKATLGRTPDMTYQHLEDRYYSVVGVNNKKDSHDEAKNT